MACRRGERPRLRRGSLIRGREEATHLPTRVPRARDTDNGRSDSDQIHLGSRGLDVLGVTQNPTGGGLRITSGLNAHDQLDAHVERFGELRAALAGRPAPFRAWPMWGYGRRTFMEGG